ncbi:MFS general substrate transporter [Aspergillus heteromorphus CBS 117.55]|uniref:MFS general substrate transporter n=1 Tax=Aspergillus heteromorphus CBS 117.55 TaxID=1448321 RepID=A0A317WEK0_9EURO|nr:MFS general substrate transporter [Aspergillus heteromorphus CBS 117.55]PWY84823.1 MFS general substrate transporter [Aspergillus heteromorphus CBS 117.55]
MSTLIQDSIAGHALRLLSRGRLFRYAEEKDPSLWRRFVNLDKSGRMAETGHPGPEPEPDADSGSMTQVPSSRSQRRPPITQYPSQAWSSNGQRYQGMTGATINPEKGRDVNVVDWWDENDRENPQNWPLWKKTVVTSEICLLTFSVYIGSAIFSAGIPDVMQKFHISQVAATLGLTLFVAGYGCGPLLWSPMSEVPQIGRNPVYIATLAVFVALQVPTALAGNLGTLLAFRFLTGFFGSPALATGGATISDMYRPSKRAYGIGIWGMSAVCGPVLGPLVGGFAAQAKGWRWTIWELMWLSGFTLVVLTIFLPETSSTNILYRRARRLRRLTHRHNLRSEPEIEIAGLTARELAMITLVRPFTLNFLEPMVFLLNLYIALIYGLLYVWFESFAIVFGEIYHFNLGQIGLAYIGILTGVIITIPPYYWWMHRYLEPKFDPVTGALPPEARLPPAIIGGLFIPVCLFWFGWSARPDIHWIMPIVGSGFFAVGAFLLFNPVLNYLSDAYPVYAASVLAGNDLFRSSFGAGFPLFATAMYRNLGVDWASSTLAFLAVAFVPIPVVLMKYGETLRKKHSRFARKDI